MSGLLLDKVCLVTGSSRGIGAAITRRFVEEGALVYACDRTEGSLEGIIGSVAEELPGRIIPVYFDLKDSEAIHDLFVRMKREQGRVDVAVNNAGVVSNEPLGMAVRADVEAMFSVNVFAVLEIMQYASRLMVRQGGGSIINISSITGVRGQSGQAAYAASKGAVISLTKSAAMELAADHVRVNSVAPGMTNTERIRETVQGQYKGIVPEIGIGRMAEPEEVADACLFFASDLSVNVSGEVLIVGGTQR